MRMYCCTFATYSDRSLTTVSSTPHTIVILVFCCCSSCSSLYHSMSSLQDGVTALLMASQNGHEEVVRLLLQSGAKDMPDNVRMFNICML